jgi:hypothetical protein
MTALVLLGLVLLGAVGAAARLGADGLRSIPLDPAVLRRGASSVATVLAHDDSFALEPLREAWRAGPGATREAWLAEAHGTLLHLLRVPVAELRACAKIVNAASFALAAWTLRAGLASVDGPDFTLEGALGQALACVVMGFLATGVVAGVNRTLAKALRADREAFVALLAPLDREESIDVRAESRA